MRGNAEALDEVVVIAYGTAKKESLTGSISVVDNKKIEKRITTSVTGALEGAAPGEIIPMANRDKLPRFASAVSVHWCQALQVLCMW